MNHVISNRCADGRKGRNKTERFHDWRAALLLPVLAVVLAVAAPDAKADFTFGEAVNLRTVIPFLDPAHDSIGCLSYDVLEMYIISGSGHDNDLCVLKRASKDDDWGPPENLGRTVNSPTLGVDDSGPSISADGLTLYFHSNRTGGYGSWDIWVTTRATKNDPWGPPVNLGPKVNSSSADVGPWISPDGLELYFHSWRPGGYGEADIWVINRATADEPWGTPVNLGPPLNSVSDDGWPCVSPDGLVLLFCTYRAGGFGEEDMWMTRRTSHSAPWQAPVNLGPKVNTFTYNDLSRISPDGLAVYFSSGRTADVSTWDCWQVPIIPIVDFNTDGKVDLVDLVMLIDNWGTNKTLCDIGPMPWGDGKIDVEDLKVFISYWEQENVPKSGDLQ